MKSNQSRNAIVAIVCALVSYSARSGQAASLPTATDPCTLLTAAEVKAAAGIDVGPPKAISKTACAWMAQTKKAEYVTVALEPVDTWSKMKQPLAGLQKNPVGGVGDDAFYAVIAQYSTLSVKKGGSVFIVRAYGFEGHDKQEAIEKQLANDVIKKL